MTAFFRPCASAVVALALCACQPMPRVANAPSTQHPFDLPPSLALSDEILPGGSDVCRKLGLDPGIPGRCNGMAVLAATGRQTDRSLWFSKTSTSDFGPLPGTCPHPVDFSRGKAGKRLVTILCGQPDADPVISQAELDQLHNKAERLNATQPKTLAQHTAAIELKHEIACSVGTATDDCD